MLLLCTSIQMFASKTCPIHEAPNWWICTSALLLFNSYTLVKTTVFCLILQYRKCFSYVQVYHCLHGQFFHCRSSTSMNLNLSTIQHLYLMKTAVFGLILQYRKCFFYVLVYQCQQWQFSPLTKLHIDESLPHHKCNKIYSNNK